MGRRESGWEPQDFIFAFADLGVMFMSDGRMELDRRFTCRMYRWIVAASAVMQSVYWCCQAGGSVHCLFPFFEGLIGFWCPV